MSGSLQHSKLLLVGIFLLIFIQIAYATTPCAGTKYSICDLTNPDASCAGTTSLSDCRSKNNQACSVAPEEIYSDGCYKEFDWATGTSFETLPPDTSKMDSEDVAGLNQNPTLLGLIFAVDPSLGSFILEPTASGEPLINQLTPAAIALIPPGNLRERVEQIVLLQFPDVILYLQPDGTNMFSCADPNTCQFIYTESPKSLALTIDGATFELSQLNGITISLEDSTIPTITAEPEAIGKPIDITCQGQAVIVTFGESTEPGSAGCTLSESAPKMIISEQTTLTATNNGLDMSVTSLGPEMNVIFGAVGEEAGLYVTGEGSLEIVGDIPAFTLDYNCATYKWDPDTQTFEPFTPEPTTASSTPTTPTTGSGSGTGSGGGGNIAPHPLAVLDITGHAVATSETCTPSNVPFTVKYGDKIFAFDDKCYLQTTVSAETSSTEPTYTPSTDDFCYDYNMDDLDPTQDATCSCELAGTFGLGTALSGIPPTAANCAAQMGLPPEYDITMEEMVTHCASHGGQYCPNYQYETICLRKAKNRPIPDDPSAWRAEVMGNYDKCTAGEIVACEGGATITAANCAPTIGLPPEYDLTQAEMSAMCNYCSAGGFETLCQRVMQPKLDAGRDIEATKGAIVDEIVGLVDACRAGGTVACSGSGAGGPGGDGSLALCSELEPKDEPSDPSIEYCANDLTCKPGTACEDGTCECTQRACRTLSSSSDDAPSPDCLKFGRNAGTAEEYCDDDVDYENKISDGGRFVFVLKGDGGGKFFIAESDVMKASSDGVKRCQPFGNFGSTPPFPTVELFTAAEDGKVFTLPPSHGMYTLGTFGGAMNEGWMCPEGTTNDGSSSEEESCTTDTDCGQGKVCACVGAACSGSTSPMCGNDICDTGETATTCPEDCSVVQGPSECTNGKIEQCFTNPDDTKCFRQRTCTDGKWGSCNVADDLCTKSCTTGIETSCPRQFGVCAGSTQTCTANAWPGCNYAQITGYESNEQSCDSLDNDCDGVTDEGCLCGLGSSRACGTDVGACTTGQQGCNLGVYNATCTGGTFPRAEVCNDGTDNDCDGSVDEGCACGEIYGENFTRTCGVNACGSGVQTCQKNGANILWGECAGAVIPELERCGDSIDNDCDGSINEGCGCVEDRACGLTDVGACTYGKQKCTNNIYGTCENAVQPVAEKCADNIDNDCDGTADENCPCTTGQTKACTGLGVCNGTTVLCVNGTFPSCNFLNVTGYQKTETLCSDKLDNDCDGKMDLNDTTCKETSSSIKCSDGTANNACSTAKPQYCDGGTLIEDCTKCLCPSGDRCDYTGRCVEDVVPPKTTPPPSGINCNYDGYCDSGEGNSCSDCDTSTDVDTTTTSDEEDNSLIYPGLALTIIGIVLLLLALQQKKKLTPKEQPKGGPTFASNLKR